MFFGTNEGANNANVSCEHPVSINKPLNRWHTLQRTKMFASRCSHMARDSAIHELLPLVKPAFVELVHNTDKENLLHPCTDQQPAEWLDLAIVQHDKACMPRIALVCARPLAAHHGTDVDSQGMMNRLKTCTKLAARCGELLATACWNVRSASAMAA